MTTTAHTEPPATNHNFAGALWMTASAISAAGLVLSVRALSVDMHPTMIAFARAGIITGLIGLLFLGRQLPPLQFTRPRLHILRGLLSAIALMLGFTAFTLLPLATVTTLFFLAPIFVIVIANFVLGEHVGLRRWLAAGAAFTGAVIIIHPTPASFDPAMLIALAASIAFAALLVIGRVITREDGPASTFVSTSLGGALFLLPFALPVWAIPTGTGWYVLAGLVLFSIGRSYSDIRAFAIGDVSFIAPFAYIRLILIAVAAYFLFHEIPTPEVYIGSSIIFCATLYITQREATLRKRSPSPADPV